MVEINKVFV